MLPITEQVLHSALALPSEERFQLIEALIATDQVPPPFDESWRDVIQRRSAEIDAGAITEVPWSEVRQRCAGRWVWMAELSYHPQAEAEIQAAAAWYLSRSQAAAVGLAEELDRVIAMIQQFPELQPPYDERHRFAVLRCYPYSVVYRMEGEHLRVIAFAHSRRPAGYWQGRA